ncbi:hypothetical protein EXU34_08660 [Alteromonas sp. ZYF713]|nr:hypothetical protein [Alteromonas sp. ZYF713]
MQMLPMLKVLFTRSVGLGLQLLLTLVMGRYLGAAGVGQFTLYNTWMVTLGCVGDMGLPTVALRNVSVSEERGQYKQIFAYITQALARLLIFSGLAAVVIIMTADYFAHVATADATLLSLFQLAVGAAVVFIIMRVLSETLKGLGYINLAFSIDTSLLPLLLLLVMGLSWLLESPLSVFQLIASHITFTVLIVVLLASVFFIILRRAMTASPSTLPTSASPHQPDSLFSRRLLPIWIGGCLGMLSLNLPVLFLPLYADAEEIGIFGVSYRLMLAGTSVLTTLASYYGPVFARAYANQDRARLKQSLKHSQKVSLLVYLPFFLLFTLFSEPLLALFGDEFTAGASLLTIMVFGQLVNTSTGLVGIMLNMIHREKEEFIIQLSNLVITVVLINVLGTLYGVAGIAAACAISIALKNVMSYIAAQHYLSLPDSPLPVKEAPHETA